MESFDDFIHHGLKRIVDAEPEIRVPLNRKEKNEPPDEKTAKRATTKKKVGKEYIVRFGEVFVDSPNLIDEERNVRYILPQEARQKNLNYSASLCLNITEIHVEGEEVTEKNHIRLPIARIPIMVGSDKCPLGKMKTSQKVESGECENDPGGYFIIKGNERVIIAQKRVNYNQVLVEQLSSKKNKTSKFRFTAETRSMSAETGHSVLLKALCGFDNRSVHFSVPYIAQSVPVGIVFKALGFVKNEEIKMFIGLPASLSARAERWLKYIYRDSFYVTVNKTIMKIETADDALEYLGTYSIHTITKDRRKQYAARVLETELLPHLGITSSAREKAIFLGYILNRLLKVVLGVRVEDERDNVSYKRYESTGILFTELFRSLYKRWLENIREQVTTKRQDIISAIARNSHITSNIAKCMATGNWGVLGNNYIRTGVSQIYSRLSFVASISHLNRVVIPVSKEGKNTKIRQVHPTQLFFECPVDTPEGSPAGIVTSLALLTNITSQLNFTLVRDTVERSRSLVPLVAEGDEVDSDVLAMVKIFLNGVPLGFCEEPYEFVEELQNWRSFGLLHPHVSVMYDREDEEIRIFCDEGRLIRPLFKVADGALLVRRAGTTGWDALVKEGYVQYLDTNEAEYTEVVMEEREICATTQYCEIHPTMMLGICGNLIPFPNHTQGPRNTYQCIWEEEPVLMGNGTWKKIKEIIVGDEIVTFNPETFEKKKTRVTHYKNNSTEKKIVEIETVGGRKIYVTEDHKIMTDKGWTEAGKIDINTDRVAIFLDFECPITFKPVKSIIFKPVKSFTRCANVRVADLTTESEFHSFIGGDGFCVHNCSMAKQALGMYALNYQVRNDTIAFVMDYPQRPLVSTKVGDIMGYNEMPCGANVIVAIISNPYSQEDAVVLNKGSLERGLFLTTSYRTVTAEEKKRSTHAQETIQLPDEKVRLKYNYSLLDEGGVVRVGVPVYRGDVIIGKVVVKREKNCRVEYVDASVIVKPNEEGIVDRVLVTVNPDGYRLVKVVIRRSRVPEVGDKFASRSAQKGTVGMIVSQEDMPFTRNGMVPDLILNPHALPSRMTISQLLECSLSKACSLEGSTGNCTAFESDGIELTERIGSKLKQHGYDPYGWETMYSGKTGEQIRAKIYIGPTYYQRLKHLVSEKWHSRSKGQITTLTRQPVTACIYILFILIDIIYKTPEWWRKPFASLRYSRRHVQIAGITLLSLWYQATSENWWWFQLTAGNMVISQRIGSIRSPAPKSFSVNKIWGRFND